MLNFSRFVFVLGFFKVINFYFFLEKFCVVVLRYGIEEVLLFVRFVMFFVEFCYYFCFFD